MGLLTSYDHDWPELWQIEDVMSRTTTTFEIEGYRVVKNYGMVRGIMVRSRSIFGTTAASDPNTPSDWIGVGEEALRPLSSVSGPVTGPVRPRSMPPAARSPERPPAVRKG